MQSPGNPIPHSYCMPTLENRLSPSREMGDSSLGAHFCAGGWQRAVRLGAPWLLAQQGQGGHQNHSGRSYVGRGFHRGGRSHDVSGQSKGMPRCLGERMFWATLMSYHATSLLGSNDGFLWHGEQSHTPRHGPRGLSWSGPSHSPLSPPTHLSYSPRHASHTGLHVSSHGPADSLPSFFRSQIK